MPSLAMLSVCRPSGQELAAISAEEFTNAGSVKKHLCEQYGFPVYLQKLVHCGRLLSDDAKLDGDMDFNDVADGDLANAAARNHIHTVRCLLDSGADKDRQDGSGMTALMHASKSGHAGVARMLVGAGAELCCKDQCGKTTLMLASESGHLEVARLLVDAGADENKEN